jgi:hypothetical protein
VNRARQPDRFLVQLAFVDRLADPQIRIGGEGVTQGRIKLLSRSRQPDRAALEPINQGRVVVNAFFGDRDNQPQIGRHHPIAGPEALAADCCRGLVRAGIPVLPLPHQSAEVDGLGGGEERNPAGLCQPVGNHVVAAG